MRLPAGSLAAREVSTRSWSSFSRDNFTLPRPRVQMFQRQGIGSELQDNSGRYAGVLVVGIARKAKANPIGLHQAKTDHLLEVLLSEN